MKKYFLGGAVAVLAISAVWLFLHQSESKSSVPSVPKANTNPIKSPAPKEKVARIGVVGDMLIHDTVYNDMKTSSGYDFRPAFRDVRPIIRSLDFAALNEETILGGTSLGLSGLYVANSPQQAGDAYRDTGFNIIQLANNHAYDRSLAGMKNTVNYWKKHQNQAITAGVYLSQTERDKVALIKKNGIKLAFLAYSWGSNLGAMPHSYYLNTLDKNLIKKDVQKAKKLGDVVMVGVHWGIEQDMQPTAAQKDLAKYMAGLDVDIVFGTHPHVLQAPEWLSGPHAHKTYVMYSLGNFLSNDTIKAPQTLTGAIMGLDIVKKVDGTVRLKNPYTVLTWQYFTGADTDFRIIPWDKVKQTEYRYGNWAGYVASEKARLSKNVPKMKWLSSKDF